MRELLKVLIRTHHLLCDFTLSDRGDLLEEGSALLQLALLG